MQVSQEMSRHRQHILTTISGKGKTTPVGTIISDSWRRCVNDYGLDPTRQREPVAIDARELRERQERLGRLLPIANAEMTNLYQQIAGTGHSIILTNAEGVVLNYIGDPSFDAEASRSGLHEGAIWSERYQGTNGMGTCLAARQPVIVHHDEHFFTGNRALSCAAAPILDPNNEMIAVLDASSESRNVQHHTMALVNMSARTIENRIFLCMFRNHFILRFHSRAEFVATLGEGLIAFQGDGKILATNQSALFQLDYKSSQDIGERKIDELFGVSIARLLQHSAGGTANPMPVHDTRHARRFFATVQIPESEQLKPQRACSAEPDDAASYRGASESLGTLEFGDPAMAQNIRIAQRVLDREIPILVKGESGTGKGVFAKAIHQASDRADRPFVAINCASIPESLIESELFGYKAGAFTGASRQGSAGKIVQADGGTLFLDEIGDMPLSLQARLLRVLEEREVVPLGAHTPVVVDLRVISATHRDLLAMVRQGTFREDLYYRLQGVTVTLPPLRERADKRNLITHLISAEAPEGAHIQIDEQVIERLVNYYWPGNIRQLRNVLRTMLALSESSRLTVDDMVDDLFRDVRSGHQESPVCEAPEETSGSSDPLLSAEREALLAELERHRWNISRAAKRLNLSRNTLYRKMKRCNISAPRN